MTHSFGELLELEEIDPRIEHTLSTIREARITLNTHAAMLVYTVVFFSKEYIHVEIKKNAKFIRNIYAVFLYFFLVVRFKRGL